MTGSATEARVLYQFPRVLELARGTSARPLITNSAFRTSSGIAEMTSRIPESAPHDYMYSCTAVHPTTTLSQVQKITLRAAARSSFIKFRLESIF